MKTNKWLIGFFAVATINLIAVLAGQQTLIWISKPLMMPLLALWLWNTTPASRLRNGWLIGLAFSTLGDILLMFPGSLNFLLGLSAFLLAHVSYIWAIRTGLPQERGFLRQQPLWFIPFAIYPLALLFWLWPDIPAAMRIPVAVYAIVIATMAQSVLNLRNTIPAAAFSSMMLGALLFVLSDSLIAVNKFGHPFSGAHVAVISTYIVGQWLLVSGVREK